MPPSPTQTRRTQERLNYAMEGYVQNLKIVPEHNVRS